MKKIKKISRLDGILIFFIFLLISSKCFADYKTTYKYINPGMSESQAIRAIVGEAACQSYRSKLAIAIGIRNRGTLKGVLGYKNIKMINKQSAKVWEEARKAWRESKNIRFHNGDHWESTDFPIPKWSYSMKKTGKYGKHIFYSSKK